MTNKTTMPDPVAYAIFAENGNIRIWSKEPQDLPDLDSLGPMCQLITTAQAEAYKDACVREALEEAFIEVMRCKTSGIIRNDTVDKCADAIRALIPKV